MHAPTVLEILYSVSNEALGLTATVVQLVRGDYSVTLHDDDAGERLATSYQTSDRDNAERYADSCVDRVGARVEPVGSVVLMAGR